MTTRTMSTFVFLGKKSLQVAIPDIVAEMNNCILYILRIFWQYLYEEHKYLEKNNSICTALQLIQCLLEIRCS